MTNVFTMARAARMLGVTENLLERLAHTMEPEDGIVMLYGTEGHCSIAFTEAGIEDARQQLSAPSIVASLLAS